MFFLLIISILSSVSFLYLFTCNRGGLLRTFAVSASRRNARISLNRGMVFGVSLRITIFKRYHGRRVRTGRRSAFKIFVSTFPIFPYFRLSHWSRISIFLHFLITSIICMGEE
ncbi:hypothetical protein PSPO01_04489 [Paraphaeosphaeria sporulosa]